MDEKVMVRKYSEKPARDAKANHTVLLLTTVMEGLLILALAVQLLATDSAYGKLGIVPIVVMLAGAIISWGLYLRNKSAESLRSYHTGRVFDRLVLSDGDRHKCHDCDICISDYNRVYFIL